MESQWKEAAATWNDDSMVGTYSDEAFKAVESHLVPYLKKPLSECTVLDIGCGTGHLARRIAPRVKHIVAVDPEPEMIANFKPAPPNAEIVCGSIDDIMPRPFDLIVASSVCAFVPDYEHILRSVAKFGGLFMQLDWLNENGTVDKRQDGFSEDMIRVAMMDAGMKLLYVDRVFEVMGMAVIGAIGRGHGTFH